jgi:AraC-like DNA-binding protein
MTEPGRLRFTPNCTAVDARFERSFKLRGTHLQVETLEGEIDRTVTTLAEVPSEGGALIFSLRGTVLFRTERDMSWNVVAAQSATFAEAPVFATIRAARGAHLCHIVYWMRGSLPPLDDWLAARREEPGQSWRTLATQPIFPMLHDAYLRFEKAIESPDVHTEQLVAAVVMEMASALTISDHSHSLAPAPKGLPELTQKLIDAVRETPSSPWPLKEAADFVGYSPFHFSRIFKSQVGMGFHEFVDRTRTEHAVRLLTGTDHAIDVVASEAGFGTTQGLRESVKEYLGLVPSELRTSPDELGV